MQEIVVAIVVVTDKKVGILVEKYRDRTRLGKWKIPKMGKNAIKAV
jgi:hypothetical protein